MFFPNNLSESIQVCHIFPAGLKDEVIIVNLFLSHILINFTKV